MADAGIDDILIPYNLVGASKLERLRGARPARRGRRERRRRAAARGARGRGEGVAGDPRARRVRHGPRTRRRRRAPRRRQPWPAEIERRDGLRFGGFLTYPSRPGAVAFLAEAERRARAAGLDVETVSAGGTPTMWASGELRPTVTEYRVGTYAFHDRATVAAGAATADEVALTVRATVVSRPSADRAVLDAGSKALTHDPVLGAGLRHDPRGAGLRRRVAQRGARRRRGRSGRLARARTAGQDRAEPRLRGRQPRRRARRPRRAARADDLARRRTRPVAVTGGGQRLDDALRIARWRSSTSSGSASRCCGWCDPVGATSRDAGFQRFLDDLVETMRAANGAGLAAPQVGVARRCSASRCATTRATLQARPISACSSIPSCACSRTRRS